MSNESRLANVKSAAKILINALEKNDAVDARYNVIDFAGTAWPQSYNVDRTGWVNSSKAINHIDNKLYIDPNDVDICTNYEAAFQEVNEW